MISSKKGAEIALNVIVISIIALIVLVVVIFIFSGKSSQFSKTVSTCETLGGTCEEIDCGKQVPPRPSLFGGDCSVPEGSPKKFCCAKV